MKINISLFYLYDKYCSNYRIKSVFQLWIQKYDKGYGQDTFEFSEIIWNMHSPQRHSNTSLCVKFLSESVSMFEIGLFDSW